MHMCTSKNHHTRTHMITHRHMRIHIPILPTWRCARKRTLTQPPLTSVRVCGVCMEAERRRQGHRKGTGRDPKKVRRGGHDLSRKEAEWPHYFRSFFSLVRLSRLGCACFVGDIRGVYFGLYSLFLFLLFFCVCVVCFVVLCLVVCFGHFLFLFCSFVVSHFMFFLFGFIFHLFLFWFDYFFHLRTLFYSSFLFPFLLPLSSFLFLLSFVVVFSSHFLFPPFLLFLLLIPSLLPYFPLFSHRLARFPFLTSICRVLLHFFLRHRPPHPPPPPITSDKRFLKNNSCYF